MSRSDAILEKSLRRKKKNATMWWFWCCGYPSPLFSMHGHGIYLDSIALSACCQFIRTGFLSLWSFIQVNLCQKLLFLHQLTHNMTTDCSLNYKFNTWKLQSQNMGRTCCVHKSFWMSKTIFVHNTFWAWNFHVCIVTQWTICRHIVG